MTMARLGALLLAAVTVGGAHAQERAAVKSAAPATAGCRFEDAGHGRVRAVLDGRTLVLEDGREVVLSGLVLPQEERGGPAKDNNKAALEALLGGRAVVLKRLAPDADRYGRLPAHVFAGDDWVQQKLLAAGHALVAARVGDFACAARLLQAERAARGAKLGLWPIRRRLRAKPLIRLRFWRSAGASPWSRAGSYPCGKAAAPFM